MIFFFSRVRINFNISKLSWFIIRIEHDVNISFFLVCLFVCLFFFLCQTLTNALQLPISVMPMLTVLTPMAHTIALVKQDIPEMDATVLVR